MRFQKSSPINFPTDPVRCVTPAKRIAEKYARFLKNKPTAVGWSFTLSKNPSSDVPIVKRVGDLACYPAPHAKETEKKVRDEAPRICQSKALPGGAVFHPLDGSPLQGVIDTRRGSPVFWRAGRTEDGRHNGEEGLQNGSRGYLTKFGRRYNRGRADEKLI